MFVNYSVEARTRFFDAVVSGMPMATAAALIRAQRGTGRIWWRQSAGMTMKLGPYGGFDGRPHG